MKEAERVADEIMCKYVRLTHYCEINTKQCALIHVEGLIELTKFYAPNISNIREELEEVKTIIENK